MTVAHRLLPCELAIAFLLGAIAPARATASSPPTSEPTHPAVMQQTTTQVSTATAGKLKPFGSAATLAAAPGSGEAANG